MGRDILFYISLIRQEEVTARAVWLGLLAALGGCDSASVARLGSHAARGGRGGCSSACTLRAQRGCSWRLATNTPNNNNSMAAALGYNFFF